MALFLNTQGISEWMSRIIDETDHELVIISPYLQLSHKNFQKLIDADERRVETVFIYREEKINEYEKSKLLALDNLSLMYHLNVHAKCIYNGNYLLISSMNFYEFSEKNNREMGVLFHKNNIFDEGDDKFHKADQEFVFNDALEEIVEIINGSEMERTSKDGTTYRFEFNILKNKKEKAKDYLNLINEIFKHKKFVVQDEDEYLCKSYMDKVDVVIGDGMEFILKFDEDKLNEFYWKHKNNIKNMKLSYAGFKFFWNSTNKMQLYVDNKHYLWKSAKSNEHIIHLKKKRIDEIIEFIKTM